MTWPSLHPGGRMVNCLRAGSARYFPRRKLPGPPCIFVRDCAQNLQASHQPSGLALMLDLTFIALIKGTFSELSV